MPVKGKSAKNYKKNPESYRKKLEYDRKRNRTEKQKKYRAKLNKANRKAGTYGNRDGMDMSHTPSGRIVAKRASSNRGSKSDRPGDRRARGKRTR